MRTLWITNDLPPRPGGIQQFVHNLLRRTWPEEALVLGPADDPAHDAAQPYTIRRHSRGLWPTPGVLRAARAAARSQRPAVVVLGATWPLGELAGALARDPGVPVVGLTHGLEAGLAGARLGRLVRRATRHLDAVTTLTAYTQQRLEPHLAARRVTRLAPGVDAEVFTPAVDGTALRQRWGIPLDAPVVGCVSRLVRRKGQDVLLAAWPEIQARHPDAWLVLVGGGPLEEQLRSRARDLGPAARVVLTGPVPWAELPAAHAALDVFAMPCRTRLAGTDVEGLGIVYLEAQACGVPAVAGASGGAPEAVRHGETGLVVDGTDREVVAATVAALLDDPERRRAMGQAGRTWVETTWSWERVAEHWRGLLERVVRGA